MRCRGIKPKGDGLSSERGAEGQGRVAREVASELRSEGEKGMKSGPQKEKKVGGRAGD